MIIVSQDKERIVNFDKVEILGIDINNKLQIACSFDEGSMVLGTYKTKERAKEVLKEIVAEYGKYFELKGGPAILRGSSDIAPAIFNVPKVYKMPEE